LGIIIRDLLTVALDEDGAEDDFNSENENEEYDSSFLSGSAESAELFEVDVDDEAVASDEESDGEDGGLIGSISTDLNSGASYQDNSDILVDDYERYNFLLVN